MTAQSNEEQESTHMVEIVDVPTVQTFGGAPANVKVEGAYQRLNARAKAIDSIIVSLVQTVNVYVADAGPRVVVTIIAQHIGRAALEEQQRRAMLAGMGGPSGPRRMN